MLDQQIIKSRQIVADYKKHNENTVEVISERPNAKTWVFKRVQTDENAYNFHAKQKKALEVEKKIKVAIKAVPKKAKNKTRKVNKPKVIKPKATAKPKAIIHGKIKQRRDSIFNDYKNGMSKLEMMEKYNIKSDSLSRDIRIKCAECNFTPLKTAYNIKKSKNELMCILLFKKLVSSVLIADQLGIPLGTVKHYRVKYYKSKNFL